MADKTKIEWTDATWNPVTGCTKVSAGCKNCYAERDFHRPYPGRDFTDVRTHPDRLDQPLRWNRPRKIFVNSMSDLFHEAIPRSFLVEMFYVMESQKRHTFQILTKRPLAMKRFLTERWGEKFEEDVQRDFSHIWLGVSVEIQKTADERIPLLLQTPAAVRFVSYEPALGPVDFNAWLYGSSCGKGCDNPVHVPMPRIDWVIAGGESGPHARPSHPNWFLGARDQCQAAWPRVERISETGAHCRVWEKRENMTFLKKLGLAIITAAADFSGFAPLINKFLPAKAQPAVQAVEGELTTIAAAVSQVEANAAAINAQSPGKITGADKLAAATPLVRLAIQGSELMAGKKIKNQALYEQACGEFTQATVDLLNSLD